MILRISEALQNAQAAMYQTLLDAGGGPGSVTFYDGPMPPDANTPPDPDVNHAVAVCQLAFPSAGGAAGGMLQFFAMSQPNALIESTPLWALFADSNGNAVFMTDVGTIACGINFDRVDFKAGAPIAVTGFSVLIPAGVG